MDLSGQRESGNVEDRRGQRAVLAGGSIGTVVIGLILYFVFGVNPQGLIQPQGGDDGPPPDPNDPLVVFVKKVLGSTEDVWQKEFPKLGARYREPKLVLFNQQVRSACGFASAAVGPFYCPADQEVYLDLTFFRDLETKLKARGDFAKAYVIAHEVGHHVQNLLGYSERARRLGEPENQQSVRLELQADYLAGVWGNRAQQALKLNSQDLESALNAAYQIGDDTLQKRASGRVMPERFTHGTSQQRLAAFRAGFETGKFTQSALDYFMTEPYRRLMSTTTW